MRLSHRRAIAALAIAATLLPIAAFAGDRVIPPEQPASQEQPAPSAGGDVYPEPIPIKPHYKFSCGDASAYAPGTIDFANWSNVTLPAGTVLVFTLHPGERVITITLDDDIPPAHGAFITDAYRHGLKGVTCDVAIQKP